MGKHFQEGFPPLRKSYIDMVNVFLPVDQSQLALPGNLIVWPVEHIAGPPGGLGVEPVAVWHDRPLEPLGARYGFYMLQIRFLEGTSCDWAMRNFVYLINIGLTHRKSFKCTIHHPRPTDIATYRLKPFRDTIQIFHIKQDQGNQCQTPGVKFEE